MNGLKSMERCIRLLFLCYLCCFIFVHQSLAKSIYSVAPNDEVIKGIKALHKNPIKEIARLSKLIEMEPLSNQMPVWLYLLSLGHEKMGRVDEALALIERCMNINSTQGIVLERAKLLQAKIFYKKGDNEKAIRQLNDIYTWTLEHGVVQLRIGVLMTLGKVFQSLRESTLALQHYNEAYALASEIKTQISASHISGLIGEIHLDEKHYELAAEYLQKALEFSITRDNILNQGRFSLLMARTEFGRGNLLESERYIEKTLSVAQATSNKNLMAKALIEKGKFDISQQKYEEARIELNNARDLAIRGNFHEQQSAALLAIARLAQIQSQFNKALDSISLLEKMTIQQIPNEIYLAALNMKSQIFEQLGDHKEQTAALTAYIEALKLVTTETDKTRLQVIKVLYALDKVEKEYSELKISTHLQSERLALVEQRNGLMILSSVMFCFLSLLLFSMYIRRVRCQRELETLATTDALTGWYNRRKTLSVVEQHVKNIKHTEKPIIMTMLDIDHFKSINDRFGHQTGDDALKLFANVGRRCFDRHAILGRIGGEEFICCLPNSNQQDVKQRLLSFKERLHEAAREKFPPHLTLSFSAGVYIFSHEESISEILEKTDKALYRAKELGRNRIEFFSSAFME